jgi:hypothetical protein
LKHSSRSELAAYAKFAENPAIGYYLGSRAAEMDCFRHKMVFAVVKLVKIKAEKICTFLNG